MELRNIWFVPQLGLCCDKCLLSRMFLFFQVVLTTLTLIPDGADAKPCCLEVLAQVFGYVWLENSTTK